ncbi:gp53-like domain-containing protein [Burkholderia ubonensis]|uniref:gp53-like domain-containing protein n=1 Tax=Burkholderia ubonensis TaxID=101571 RepID=UPI00075D2881|nr:hypothetical protein [Burkholderia ubonensis]KVD59460.1 hypothetical protein WI86_33900 [Burkholderia ubonensis]KVD71720.1 hypothetical protein WI88_29260 [Burkholderia ubonensis]KVP61201.1 hypothetical protein WJ90_28430 [Burkholderia ubonensis]KVR38510.1 hypothetical protein WK16_14905 [Burkholderia ubonensis]KVU28176.1 hypothetical protein WK64_23440 [Burkholderia ubonensis]
MSNLIEVDRWENGIYQLETSDPVIGGPDGIDNLQAKQLANRTQFLKRLVEGGQSNLDAHANAADPHPQYATKADLAQRLAELVGQSPAALDTLKELADALGNDPNFATTITNELAKRAAIDSPVFTGTPKGPTPPQFDSSDRLASTGFVQRALGNMQIGTRIQSAANAIFSASHAGGSYTLEVASTTYVLPSLASVKPGATFEYLATVNAATVATAGADKMMTGSLVSSSTCVLNNGDTAKFVSDGTYWVLVSGSAALRLSLGDFGSSLSTNGYQKLPSGLIIQWGLFQINFSSTPQTASGVVTYPLAFPNGVLSVTATSLSSTPSAYPAPSVVLTSASQFTAYAYGAVNNAGQSYYYIAIGR